MVVLFFFGFFGFFSFFEWCCGLMVIIFVIRYSVVRIIGE